MADKRPRPRNAAARQAARKGWGSGFHTPNKYTKADRRNNRIDPKDYE